MCQGGCGKSGTGNSGGDLSGRVGECDEQKNLLILAERAVNEMQEMNMQEAKDTKSKIYREQNIQKENIQFTVKDVRKYRCISFL